MKLALAFILLAGLASGMPAAAPAGCCPSAGGDDYAPVWSPSGTLVAFTRIGQIDSGTFIVRPDGSGLKRLSGQWPFSWAPSGDLLAFGGGGIDIVDTSGNVVRRLTEEDGSDPSWSPDGRTIAFASSRSGAKGLYVVSASGGPARRVTGFPESSHPDWSPDGSQFAFMGRGACRKAGILTVSSSGGSPPELITNDCYIVGSDGDDQLTGTWDRDIAYGRSGNDVIRLDTSDDEGWGEAGDDRLLGERGSDVLVGGPGHDTLVGDRGNDRLWTADGEVDELDCGPQVDWVVADRVDHISGNCEHVRLVR